MKPLFSRNIDKKGRLIRGLGALILLGAAGFGFAVSVWLGIALTVSGVFVAFEAVRGWCALRACGIAWRTKRRLRPPVPPVTDPEKGLYSPTGRSLISRLFI
jgi:hypothetical protein